MKTLPKKIRSESKISVKKSRRQSRPTEWLVDKTDTIRETLNKSEETNTKSYFDAKFSCSRAPTSDFI